METLRECWNKRLSPNEFISQIPDSLENTFAQHLLDLCGSDIQPFQLFLDYLEKLIEKPNVCEEIFTNTSNYNKNGLLNLINTKGNIIFENIEIGSQNASKCALNALSLCLESEDSNLIHQNIEKLTESSKFSILIASARVNFPDEFTEVANRAKNIILNPNILSPIPFPLNILHKALFSSKKTKDILFSRHDFTLMALSYLILDSPDLTCLSFLEIPTFYHLYLHAVTDFLSNPTMHSEFLITNLLVRVYVKLTGGDISSLSVNEFSREYLTELLSKLQSSDHDNQNYLDENRENCDYLNKSTDYSTLPTILINETEEFNPEKFLDYSFENPSFASRIVESASDMIKQYNSQTKDIILNIMKNFDDFLFLMIWQNKFYDFIQILMNLSLSMRDLDPIEDFQTIFYFGLSLIRKAWGTGRKTLRDGILNFISNQENESLRDFLTQFLNPQELPNYLVLGTNYRFNELVKFIKELNENPQIDGISPPHYISVILTGLRVEDPRPIIAALGKHQLPHFPAVDILYRQLLSKVAIPTKRVYVRHRADFDTIMQNRPKTIEDIVPTIIDQLNLIARNDNKQEEINDIVTYWSACIEIFGFCDFCHTLIEKIIWKTAHASVPDDTSALFGSVAFVLAVLVNGNDELIDKAIEIGCEFAINNSRSMPVCIGLSRFVLSFVCVCSGDWKKRFDKIIGIAIDIINDNYETQQPHDPTFFGVSLIKSSLLLPTLQSNISDDVVQALLKIDDAKTIIEYFIVKAESK